MAVLSTLPPVKLVDFDPEGGGISGRLLLLPVLLLLLLFLDPLFPEEVDREALLLRLAEEGGASVSSECAGTKEMCIKIHHLSLIHI